MTSRGEQWRPVSGYEGSYEVSDRGRVKSLARFTTRIFQGKTLFPRIQERILRPGKNTSGYPVVVLFTPGSRKTQLVHHLVAKAFIGPMPAGEQTRHKNGKRHDARASNLEYGTASDNARDMVKHGTCYFKTGPRNSAGRMAPRSQA